MEWIECKAEVERECVEIVSAVLIESGVGGFQVEDDRELQEFLSDKDRNWDYAEDALYDQNREEVVFTFYVSNNDYGLELLSAVRSNLLFASQQNLDVDISKVDFKTVNVDEDTWLNEWKKYYKPFKIGERVIIRPSWEEYTAQGNEVVFNIEPGHVFGTGQHDSTRLCIEQLEKHVKEKDLVLDLGCGSGILSIIALLLGADFAYACDIDANAKGVAYENAALNNIDVATYKVEAGNILEDEALINEINTRKYDVVVANIVADVIIGISDFSANALKDGGVFITSGIINERVDDVTEAIGEAGLTVVDTIHSNGWACIVARKG